MNHTLTLALAILLLAATGWGETHNEVYVREDGAYVAVTVSGETNKLIIGTSTPPVALNYMACSASNTLMSVESRIRKLAASGEICRVLGFHCWGTDWANAFHAIYNPEGQRQSRKCRICGKVETKTEVWK